MLIVKYSFWFFCRVLIIFIFFRALEHQWVYFSVHRYIQQKIFLFFSLHHICWCPHSSYRSLLHKLKICNDGYNHILWVSIFRFFIIWLVFILLHSSITSSHFIHHRPWHYQIEFMLVVDLLVLMVHSKAIQMQVQSVGCGRKLLEL